MRCTEEDIGADEKEVQRQEGQHIRDSSASHEMLGSWRGLLPRTNTSIVKALRFHSAM